MKRTWLFLLGISSTIACSSTSTDTTPATADGGGADDSGSTNGTDAASTDDGASADSSGADDGGADDGSTYDAEQTSLPACSWPAKYDAPDASAGACSAARTYLSCEGSNGGGVLCPSDNPTKCPDTSATPGVTYDHCKIQCAPDEYVIMCGTMGIPGDASPDSVPPAACHLSAATNPGGREPYCCPCGS